MIIHSPKDLALLVKRQRKQEKLSQAWVGAKVGLKQNTLSHFEHDPQMTQLDTLFRILSALDLEMQIKPKQKVDIQEW